MVTLKSDANDIVSTKTELKQLKISHEFALTLNLSLVLDKIA